MKRPTGYNTKQSQAILDYIASLGGSHVTVGQIAGHFESIGFPIGLTTVYRHLDKLVRSGRARRYIMEGVSGSCYQYEYAEEDIGVDVHARAHEGSAGHFHLKCEDCGALLHLQCEVLSGLPKRVYEEHSFRIDASKTVFYGKCADCLSRDAERPP
ncbi:MAG: transcriptional repressor [Synergistaceae bacterium]|nr:transcriptional repressor [Synergistaceae bacterium]